MSTQSKTGDSFEQLMAIAHAEFTDRRFSVAYHVLAAAYHYAADNNSESELYMVECVVREQLAWIDANASDYKHSTQSAATRNHASIFTLLSQQAGLKLRQITIEQSLFGQYGQSEHRTDDR